MFSGAIDCVAAEEERQRRAAAVLALRALQEEGLVEVLARSPLVADDDLAVLAVTLHEAHSDVTRTSAAVHGRRRDKVLLNAMATSARELGYGVFVSISAPPVGNANSGHVRAFAHVPQTAHAAVLRVRFTAVFVMRL